MGTEPQLPVSGVILAAGEGRRLRPVTEHTPKALLPAFGTPLLDIAAAQLVRVGVRRVAVNAHHLGEAVARRVGDVLEARYPQVRWKVSREPALLGTGGALARLTGWLGEAPFWVVNADALVVADLAAMAKAWRDAGADAAMMVSGPGAHGVVANVRVDGRGYVVGLGPGAAARRMAYCGVLVTAPGLLGWLARAAAPSCVVRQGILPWHAAGGRVLAWDGAAWFADTGTPERYVAAHRTGLEHMQQLRELGVFGP